MEIKQVGVIKTNETTNCKEYPSITGRLNGKLARMSANIVTCVLTKWALVGKLKRNMGVDDLMSYKIEDNPLDNVNKIYATNDILQNQDPQYENLESLIKTLDNIKPYKTLGDYYYAYRENKVTPTQICEKIIELAKTDQLTTINAIIEMDDNKIRKAAIESTERYKNDKPLSVIDGIPFLIKDQIENEGYHICYGMSSKIDKLCTTTCTVVKKLLDSGAILIGITNMTYGGLNVIGFNPSKKHGSVRNPYNTEYYCGGSSNGSAAIVSCGLVPFAIGLDGYGSNRIPPAFTGVVGIRPTLYRVTNGGTVYENSTHTVIAPITATVRDSAIIYSIIAGADNNHQPTLYQPHMILPTLTNDYTPLISKIKIGYDQSLTNFAVDKSIITSMESTIKRLRDIGFNIINYCVPEMHEINVSSKLLFMKESHDYLDNLFKQNKLDYNMECANATIIHNLGGEITPAEYEQALRQLQRSQSIIKDMFSKFDIFISPMTSILAPKIVDGDEYCGVLDDTATIRIIQYSGMSSCCGTPSITLQIDTTDDNLPVAIQLQSSWWNEHLLYELAYIIESFLPLEKRKPTVFTSPF